MADELCLFKDLYTQGADAQKTCAENLKLDSYSIL